MEALTLMSGIAPAAWDGGKMLTDADQLVYMKMERDEYFHLIKQARDQR